MCKVWEGFFLCFFEHLFAWKMLLLWALPSQRKIFEGGKYSLFEVDLVIITRKLITIWGTFGLSKNKITM
jgi:hypothetical protein